jgi:integrase/recombinase XerD
VKVPVQLYVRVKLDDGSYPYLKAVMQPNNGHVRPDYAMKAGRVMRVQGGVYHLSYRKDGKRVWEPVGTDAGVALVKLTAKKREFEDAKLKHRAKPNGASENAAAPAQALQVQPKPAKRLLSACIVEYLAETKEHKEPKTYAAYSKSVLSFAEMMFSVPEHKGLSLARARALYIEDLTRKQAMAWIAELKGKGNQPRTLFNRANNLNIFLRHFGLPALFNKKDKPKYTDKKVRAYNRVELEKMFDAATETSVRAVCHPQCLRSRGWYRRRFFWLPESLDTNRHRLLSKVTVLAQQGCVDVQRVVQFLGAIAAVNMSKAVKHRLNSSHGLKELHHRS